MHPRPKLHEGKYPSCTPTHISMRGNTPHACTPTHISMRGNTPHAIMRWSLLGAAGTRGTCMYNSTWDPARPSAQKEASEALAVYSDRHLSCCCSAMTICWEYAVGILWEGTLHIISDWKVRKAAAQAEYMGICRAEYKAFIIRRAVKDLPDGTWWVRLPDVYEL
jgi:hypothetical protein